MKLSDREQRKRREWLSQFQGPCNTCGHLPSHHDSSDFFKPYETKWLWKCDAILEDRSAAEGKIVQCSCQRFISGDKT